MKPYLTSLLLLALAAPAFPASAQEAADAMVWERQDAVAAARSVDTQPLLRSLERLTIAGDAIGTVELLEHVRQRTDWPEPARDATLHGYIADLRRLPATAVPVELLGYLRGLEPMTLVPHEDHAGGYVPLFNLRGALAGVEHQWLREEALTEGIALLAVQPESLLDVFLLEEHPAARGGYVDSLARASTEQLLTVLVAAGEQLESRPGLAPLAGRAALRAGDLDRLVSVLVAGEKAAATPLLRDAAAMLSPQESAELLQTTLAATRAEVAALALAELYPQARFLPETRSLALDLLGDRELGSAAALALARDDSGDLDSVLNGLARGDSLAASRARLALSLRQETPWP